MKKLINSFICIIFSFTSLAQQGTLSFDYNPTNLNGNNGDIATKINASYKLYLIDNTVYLDISWNIFPTDYLFWQGKKYTIQQLGSQFFNELNIQKNISCIADAYFEGSKFCEVIFDASGCQSPNTYSKNPAINCSRQPIDSKNGERSDLLPKTWKEAFTIWNSGKVRFQNLRLLAGQPSIFNPYPMVPDAIKKLEGNITSKTQSNQQSQIKNNNTSYNSKTLSNNTEKSQTNNQNTYNQIVNNANNIVKISNNASNQVTQMVNQYFGSREEQKAQREQKLKKEEEQYKKEQDLKERITNESNNLSSENFNRKSEEFENSYFKKREVINNALINDKIRFENWITACKTGTKESLEKFIIKYKKDYFSTEIASFMIEAWKNGKSNPNTYLKTAIFEGNWVLTKFLLDNGGNPEFQMKTAFGDYYNPILQLLAPRFSPAIDLSYTGNDKFDFLKKMINQGADPNALKCEITHFQTDYYTNKNNTVECKQYAIREILSRDYGGVMLKWLLDNKKLNKESMYDAMAFLITEYGLLSSKTKSDYANILCKEYPTFFKMQSNGVYIRLKTDVISIEDNILIQMKDLVEHKASLSGNNPISNGNSSCINTPFSVENYPFFLTRDFPVTNNVSLQVWLDLQKAILARSSEIDKEYIRKLLISIITLALPRYGLTDIVDAIVEKKIINPKSKELWYKKEYHSLMSLTRNYGGSEWLKYIKNKY